MTIVLATGGSGGHIFPALRTAQRLKEKGVTVEFCGVFGEYCQRINAEGFACYELPARGLKTDSLKTVLSSGFSMLKSFSSASGYLRRVRPSAVVGFGGYGAFAVVAAAIIHRCPVMIHEQNVVPGRANRLLGRWVNRIALSFEKSRSYWPSAKIVVTGCPYRNLEVSNDQASCRRKFNLSADKWTILVFGGSQGSRRINSEFMKFAELLKKQREFQVIHIAGPSDVEHVRREYARLGVSAFCTAFLDDMASAYGAADMVIARSGAVTVTEIASIGLPAVLIPYPWAGGHQIENARILADHGTAQIITEDQISSQRLAEAVIKMADQPVNRNRQVRGLQGVFFPDADARLARAIMEIVGNEN